MACIGAPRRAGQCSVVGLDHIVLRCADVEKSLAFYCDALGLAARARRRVAARRGAVPVGADHADDDHRPASVPSAPDGTNVDHFCLVIEPTDLDALAASFPDAERADGLFGAQGFASSLYVHDPDGNTIELRSYA